MLADLNDSAGSLFDTIFDVCISGSGPAGLPLALKLAACKHRVLLRQTRSAADNELPSLAKAQESLAIEIRDLLDFRPKRVFFDLNGARNAADLISRALAGTREGGAVEGAPANSSLRPRG